MVMAVAIGQVADSSCQRQQIIGSRQAQPLHEWWPPKAKWQSSYLHCHSKLRVFASYELVFGIFIEVWSKGHTQANVMLLRTTALSSLVDHACRWT